MPSVSYTPQNDAEAAQVARLKVIVGAELPRRLADRTIVSVHIIIVTCSSPLIAFQPCKMVFGSQGCALKAGQPLTISFMFPEEYTRYISASLETCITYSEPSETDQPVADFQVRGASSRECT